MKKFITSIFVVFLAISCSIINPTERKDAELRAKLETMMMPDFRYWKMENEEEKKDFTEINDEVKKVIRTHNYGGIILFSQNIKDNAQTAKLIYELQKNSKKAMFIATDQEGGIVARLNSGTRFPGNMALGATNDYKNAYLVGKTIGAELSSLGINVNFAPDLDVNVNPKNPVIGLRSFGEDPELVAKMGVEFIKGLKSENILSTAKHFPGHGDVDMDSHLGLASIPKDKVELDKTELYPFKEAIKNGVDMIMTAHIQLPLIEDGKIISKTGESIYLPATISPKILTGILRNELNFNGIIVTDALQGMKAITDNIDEYEVLKMSINAGADIMLMPVDLYSLKDVEKLDNIIDKLIISVKKGEIKEETIDKAYNRIIQLKKDKNIKKPSLNIEKANKIVGSKEHKALERKISLDAITVIKDTKLKPVKNLLVLGNGSSQKGITNFAIDRLKKENKIDNINYEFLIYNDSTTKETIENIAKNFDTIIVYGAMNNEKALSKESYRTKVPNYVAELENIQKIFISINKPYDVANHLSYDKVLIAYGYAGIDPTETNVENKAFGPNIPAALEVSLLDLKTNSKLPVSIPVIKDDKMSGEILFKKADNFNVLDEITNKFIEKKIIPGSVVLVSKNGEILYHKAIGNAQVLDNKEVKIRHMDKDTMFDIASLTKIFATTQSIMNLVYENKLDLDDLVSKYIPEFAQNGKENVRIKDLLTHTSGLTPWLPIYYHSNNRADSYNYVFKQGLVYKTGEKRKYSDLSFITLAKVVENITKMPINKYVLKKIYTPLGLENTRYLPLEMFKKEKIASTSLFGNPFEEKMIKDDNFGYKIDEDFNSFVNWRNYTLTGEVNDGNSFYAFNGVAGHAGLFSTAKDLYIIGELLLNNGEYNNVKLYNKKIKDTFTKQQSKFGHGFGYEINVGGENKGYMGKYANENFVGHTGFTGTQIVYDLKNNIQVIILTNKQNMGTNEKGSYNSTWPYGREIMNAVGDILYK